MWLMKQFNIYVNSLRVYTVPDISLATVVVFLGGQAPKFLFMISMATGIGPDFSLNFWCS